MQTIQVVIDEKLLRKADKFVKRSKGNRSALIREALEGHLRRIEIREMVEQDRRGYLAKPQDAKEIADLEAVSVWPED
jgi:metal-responsive CopG/Arc/MetJ family transcriptional regulator